MAYRYQNDGATIAPKKFIPGGRSMHKDIGYKKGQVGLYLTPTCRHLLADMAANTGITMSILAETAIREYAFNHKEQLEFNRKLKNG